MNFFWVFLGGGVGSILRYSISLLFSSFKWTFPYATLVANILSCILLGFLVALSFRGGLSNSSKYFLMTGLCGGFSTFSTFTNETFQLYSSGNYAYALGNIGISIVLCLIAIYIGIKLGE